MADRATPATMRRIPTPRAIATQTGSVTPTAGRVTLVSDPPPSGAPPPSTGS